jgi:hypothetical protein
MRIYRPTTLTAEQPTWTGLDKAMHIVGSETLNETCSATIPDSPAARS